MNGSPHPSVLRPDSYRDPLSEVEGRHPKQLFRRKTNKAPLLGRGVG